MTNLSNPPFDVFSSAWLRGLPEDSLRKLVDTTEFAEFGNGETIYALGGPQEWLWGISAGQVRVLVAMIEMEPVLGHIHHPGAWFGESELIQGIDGLVEMKAIGTTTLAKVPYSRFRSLANQRPELWEAFARLTSMNQLLAMSAANDLALRSPRKRIAAALLRLSGRRGVFQGSLPSDLVIATQQDVASLGNIALSKASVHLGAMAEEGHIRLEYGRISLTNPAGLLAIIQS